MKISASVLATSITSLDTVLTALRPGAIDYIHMDVMDGHFVPQISFGEGVCREVGQLTEIPLDVHLMVDRPENHVSKYYELKPEYITFHAEATDFMVRLCEDIRNHGSKAGIALNPSTPLDTIRYVLPYIDLILIMTVDPGFYGQKFFQSGIAKIQAAREMIADQPIALEVDGGVNTDNIAAIDRAGANICVAGSAVFSKGSPSENSSQLKKLTDKSNG